MTNKSSKLIEPNKAINIKIILAVLIVFIQNVLTGCASNDISTTETSFISENIDSESSHNDAISKIENEEDPSDLSNEVLPPSPSQLLDNAISATKNKTSFKYILLANVTKDNEVLEHKCEVVKNGYDISLSSTYSSDSLLKQDFYINGVSYVNDEILGKCMFKSEYNDFENITKNCYNVYELSCVPEDIDQLENGSFQFALSQDILNESFIKELISASNAQEISFTNGECTIITNDDGISQIKANIEALYVVDAISKPFKVEFKVFYEDASKIIEPSDDEYKDYKTLNDFLLSKSSYNIISRDAYEILETTRFYTDFDNNEYKDIVSSTTASFLKQSTNFTQRKEVLGKTNYISEKSIISGIEYTRCYSSDVVPPEFTSSEYEDDLSGISIVKLWNHFPFDTSNLKQYSVVEKDDYYIINFVYSDDSSNKMFLAYYNALCDAFPTLFSKEANLTYSKTNEAVGEAVIRKDDFLLIEQKINISITYNQSKAFKLVYSSEVIALDDDVSYLPQN